MLVDVDEVHDADRRVLLVDAEEVLLGGVVPDAFEVGVVLF